MKAIGYFQEKPGVSKSSGQETITKFCAEAGHELIECHSEQVAGQALAECLASLDKETPLLICISWGDLLQGSVHDQHATVSNFVGNVQRHELKVIDDGVDTTTKDGYEALINGMWQVVYNSKQQAILKKMN